MIRSSKPSKIPRYSHHKPSGQARVIIAGKHHYLGKYGTPESWDRYHRLIAGHIVACVDQLMLRFDPRSCDRRAYRAVLTQPCVHVRARSAYD